MNPSFRLKILLLIVCLVAPGLLKGDTLSARSDKLVKVLSPFIGKFEGSHEGVKLNATFDAHWNRTKTAMFFTWTSEWEDGTEASQIFGTCILNQKGNIVWHLTGSDGSKIEMNLVKSKKGKFEFVMTGSTPVGTLYEEVYWQLLDNGDFDHVITKKAINGTEQEAFGFVLKKKPANKP
jgi:hypothetical protein